MRFSRLPEGPQGTLLLGSVTVDPPIKIHSGTVPGTAVLSTNPCYRHPYEDLL